MDHDSRTQAQFDADTNKDYKADTTVYVPLETRLEVLENRYGITIDRDARTIEIDLRIDHTNRRITTNNIATDEKNFIHWDSHENGGGVTINNGRANFTVRERPDMGDAAYIGVYLNYDSDPAKNETFIYNDNTTIEFDFNLFDPNAEVILVMTQTDINGRVIGQLNFPLAGYASLGEPLQMKHFTSGGVIAGDSAFGDILRNGDLHMSLPVNDAYVVMLDQAATRFTFNPRTDYDAHMFIDVRGNAEDFLSSISIGLNSRNSSGQSISGRTDPTSQDYLDEMQNFYVGLVDGVHRYRIPLEFLNGLPGAPVSIEGVSFNSVTDTARTYDIAAISLHVDNSSEHKFVFPRYLDRNQGWWGGLGFAILQGAGTGGEMGSFKVGDRVIGITETTHALQSKVMRLSWTTHADSMNYTIQSHSGSFRRNRN